MNRVGIVIVTVFARLSLKLFGEDAVANRRKAETIPFELMMLLSQFPGNRLLRRTRVFGCEIAHGHIFPEIHFFGTYPIPGDAGS
jgi:hypothetical protein